MGARVLVACLELAVVRGETERAAGLREELAGLELTAAEREGLAAELARVDALL